MLLFKVCGYCIELTISSFENSDIRYILEADVEYPKRLQNFHNDLPFLPERMKIKNCNKLVCNLYDKKHLCYST